MDNKFTLKEKDRMAQGLPPWESMSFACGGWLQFYMFGVGKAIQTAGLDKGVMYSGCSAGALAATGLALQGSFDDGVQYCKDDAVPTAYQCLYNLFQLQDYVGGSIDRCLIKHFDQEKLKNLQVATTRVAFTNQTERIKTFKSPEDLKSALLASCAAWPVSRMEYRDGAYYCDGGVTDFQPIIDSDTITVSPFYFSDCDIKPSRYVPLWWAFLPPNSNDTIDWLYSLGYEDGMRYIEKRDILSHVVRENTSSINGSSSFASSSESVTSTPSNKTLHSEYAMQSVSQKCDLLTACDGESESTPADGVTTPTYLTNNARFGRLSPSSQLRAQSPQIRRFKQKSSTLRQVRHLIHDFTVMFKSRMTSAPHPYDVPRTVSMHRFLGYDLTKTNNRFAFLCDLFLLGLLLLVWKPFALFVIYMELLWRIGYLTFLCVLNTVGIDGYVLYRLGIFKPSAHSSKKSVYTKLYDCILCVLSLSLLLRFISGGPSAVELRKHDRLAKNSLLYRVFRHII